MITIVQYLIRLFIGKKSKYLWSLLGIVILLFSGYYLYKDTYNKGYLNGVESTSKKYEQRILEEKRKEEIKRIKLKEDVKYLRDDLERKQVEYQKAYEKGKRDAEIKANAIISDIESRNRRLSIEIRDARKTGKTRVACDTSSTSTGVRRAELSERASRFLITQATLADNKVRELNLCKLTLHEMRKTVDEYNKRLETKK